MTITGTAKMTQIAATELVRAAGLKLGHWDFRLIADSVNSYIADQHAAAAEGEEFSAEYTAEDFFELVCESPKLGDFENTPNIYDLGLGKGWPLVWRSGAVSASRVRS